MLLPSENNLTLTAYCDSDWGGCQTTRRSVSGYCIFLGFLYYLMEVKKIDKRIKIISGSRIRAMTNICLEIVWLRYLLLDLKVPCNLPTQLFCDNQATLQVTYQSFICNDTVSARTYFYKSTKQGTVFDATTQVGSSCYQLEGSIKEIIIIKLYAIIVCNIVRYCTQLYAINLIMIESHD